MLSLAERTIPAFPPAVDGRRADLHSLALDRDDAERSAWLVMPTPDGVRHYEGADALGELLRHQPSPGHRFAGHLLSLAPIAVAAQASYRVIARNRHRLPGGTAACAIGDAPPSGTFPRATAA